MSAQTSPQPSSGSYRDHRVRGGDCITSIAAAAGSDTADSAEMTATPSAPAPITSAALVRSMPAMAAIGSFGAMLATVGAYAIEPSESAVRRAERGEVIAK